jgi:hypothetical protein
MHKLKEQLEYALFLLTNLRMTSDNRLKLYEAAIKHLGKDASPNDLAPDELACAETVNEIIRDAFGNYFYSGSIVSTYYMYKALRDSSLFKEVSIPTPGDVVISPTGYATKSNVIPNGHVGIVMLEGKIASNDSRDGVFRENYTIDSWKERYVNRGGYILKFYRRV